MSNEDEPRSKYGKRLDKTRDHGTNHPPEEGVFYWQDGIPFDHEGYVVDAVAETLAERMNEANRASFMKKLAGPKKPAASVPASKPAAPAAKPPRPVAPVEEEIEEGTETDPPPDEVNLEMWLRGEAEYPFAKVQAAVKKRFSVHKTSRRDLVLFLVEEQKIMPPESLSADNLALIGG